MAKSNRGRTGNRQKQSVNATVNRAIASSKKKGEIDPKGWRSWSAGEWTGLVGGLLALVILGGRLVYHELVTVPDLEEVQVKWRAVNYSKGLFYSIPNDFTVMQRDILIDPEEGFSQTFYRERETWKLSISNYQRPENSNMRYVDVSIAVTNKHNSKVYTVEKMPVSVGAHIQNFSDGVYQYHVYIEHVSGGFASFAFAVRPLESWQRNIQFINSTINYEAINTPGAIAVMRKGTVPILRSLPGDRAGASKG